MAGTIRITAPQDIAQTLVAKIISKLLPKFSKIQSKDMYQAISYLTKENIDIAFRAG